MTFQHNQRNREKQWKRATRHQERESESKYKLFARYVVHSGALKQTNEARGRADTDERISLSRFTLLVHATATRSASLEFRMTRATKKYIYIYFPSFVLQ